jgi:hypothetical protein
MRIVHPSIPTLAFVWLRRAAGSLSGKASGRLRRLKFTICVERERNSNGGEKRMRFSPSASANGFEEDAPMKVADHTREGAVLERLPLRGHSAKEQLIVRAGRRRLKACIFECRDGREASLAPRRDLDVRLHHLEALLARPAAQARQHLGNPERLSRQPHDATATAERRQPRAHVPERHELVESAAVEDEQHTTVPTPRPLIGPHKVGALGEHRRHLDL